MAAPIRQQGTGGDRTLTREAPRHLAVERPEARLVVVHPGEHAEIFLLGKAPLLLGRRPGSELAATISDATVSRRHLEVTWDAVRQTHLAADLGSHNGSWVDGERLAGQPAALRSSSVVRLGDVLLVYEREPGAASGLAAADGQATPSRPALPGNSVAVRLLRGLLARAAPDPAPMLVWGETGVGKEVVASEIHRQSGRRGKLLAVNCAALNPSLIESQLFGHVRGAFTGAIEAQPGLFRCADGGTLVLDEVGELPLELQPKLLRAIQEGEVQPVGGTQPTQVDVRLLAVTNRDLAAEVERGAFRRDLFARLSRLEIRVPPLRERRADLLAWIARLGQAWRELRPGVETGVLDFDAEAAESLLLGEWPDNLRGVERLVHHFSLDIARPRPLGRADLPPWVTAATLATSARPPGAPAATAAQVRLSAPLASAPPRQSPSSPPSPASSPSPASARLPAPTREELVAVLQRTGSVRATAKHFGRDRRQIYRWIEAMRIDLDPPSRS